jgi:hypothetical protein
MEKMARKTQNVLNGGKFGHHSLLGELRDQRHDISKHGGTPRAYGGENRTRHPRAGRK